MTDLVRKNVYYQCAGDGESLWTSRRQHGHEAEGGTMRCLALRRGTRSIRGARAVLTVPLLVLVLAFVLGAAGPAVAAPQEPVMTMARLNELLTASPTGTVTATFKTVVKGDDIVSIPCVIDGVVPHAAADNGDLIMFQASGTIIEQAGGIAAGMSGSPVYVDDGGARLVGAVSYGEYFTSNGLGLATPIEHMMTLEDDFTIDPLAARLAKAVDLSRPLDVDGQTVRQVVVAPTTATARGVDRTSDAVIMRPLSVLQIGGVPADLDSVKALKAAFAREGVELRTGLAGGAAGSEPEFETPLVPGSSVGELFMRGDVWLGGGTTTYTTADGKLVAYGHPGMWDGYLSAYMTNADVIGLWNNAEESHKVVSPGKVRGAITVDSGPGIAGVVGDTAIRTTCRSPARRPTPRPGRPSPRRPTPRSGRPISTSGRTGAHWPCRSGRRCISPRETSNTTATSRTPSPSR